MRAARAGRGVGADVGEALVDVGDAAGIVRRLRLGQQARALLVGGEHELDQAFRPARRFLRHPADAGGAGHVDAAVVGLQLARDQAQQRGLARAVAADEADLVPRRNAGRGLVEDDAPLDAVGEVVDVQHGRKAIAECGRDVMGLVAGMRGTCARLARQAVAQHGRWQRCRRLVCSHEAGQRRTLSCPRCRTARRKRIQAKQRKTTNALQRAAKVAKRERNSAKAAFSADAQRMVLVDAASGLSQGATARVMGGDVAEGHGGAQRDAGAGIGASHHRIHVVAAGVEAGHRRAVAAQDLRELVGDEAGAGAEFAGVKLDRIERRRRDRADAGVGFVRGIAEVALIDVAALGEIEVDAGGGKAVVARDGFGEARRIDLQRARRDRPASMPASRSRRRWPCAGSSGAAAPCRGRTWR